jgi:hypothetical protein
VAHRGYCGSPWILWFIGDTVAHRGHFGSCHDNKAY